MSKLAAFAASVLIISAVATATLAGKTGSGGFVLAAALSAMAAMSFIYASIPTDTNTEETQ